MKEWAPDDAFQCGRCPLAAAWPGADAMMSYMTYDLTRGGRDDAAWARVAADLLPSEVEALRADMSAIDAEMKAVLVESVERERLEQEARDRTFASEVRPTKNGPGYQWRR